MFRTTLFSLLLAPALVACGGGSSGSSGGTKACPEGAPFCVTLPAGFTMGTVSSGSWGANVSVTDATKKLSATLYWVKPSEYDGRVLSTEGFFKGAAGGKKEVLLGGKGVYFDYPSKDPKEDRHLFESFVKGDTHTWQCTGWQPKAATGTELGAICKSIAAK